MKYIAEVLYGFKILAFIALFGFGIMTLMEYLEYKDSPESYDEEDTKRIKKHAIITGICVLVFLFCPSFTFFM